MKKSPWYEECIDRCARCNRKGNLIKLYDSSFYFVKCSKCKNTAKSGNCSAIALCNWNIKNRKIKGAV